jgi:predicted Zn-dependent protease with MMP-like domain
METNETGNEFLRAINFVIRQTISRRRSSASQKRGADRSWNVALEQAARQNRDVKLDSEKLCALAQTEVEATIKALPSPLRARAEKLPVIFDRHPSAELLAEGIEADTLGLFAGAEFVEENDVPLPPQIILFLENIWSFAEANEKHFREEVRTTFLHELGHYLGLDEKELTDRGLE